VQNHPQVQSQRRSLRRRPRTDRWDINNIVSHPTDSVNYVPFSHSDRIDIPTWRVLTDQEQESVVVHQDESEESSEEENTEDDYYEQLHSDQNQRIREMIQQAQLRKKVEKRGKVGPMSDEEELGEEDDMVTQ